MERIEAVSLERQRLQVYMICFSKQAKGCLLKETDITLMATASLEGCGREPDIKLVTIRITLSRTGMSYPQRQ